MVAETALVFDNQESIREILTAWLEEKGCNTVTSTNEIEASESSTNIDPTWL